MWNLHEGCVVGLGYIGLPTALMLASRGVRVTGVIGTPPWSKS
jgi:UDP-N-acetyl-D-mannosaminuronate dehydrogenase